jgi:hypothetical protein
MHLHNPASPVVKMSPRCEFFRIGGRGSKSLTLTGAAEAELLRQSLEEESDSDASSTKETVSQDSNAGGRDVPSATEAPQRTPEDVAVKVP